MVTTLAEAEICSCHWASNWGIGQGKGAENANWKWGVTPGQTRQKINLRRDSEIRRFRRGSPRSVSLCWGNDDDDCDTWEKWLPAIVSLLLAKQAAGHVFFWLWCWQIASIAIATGMGLWMRCINGTFTWDIYQNLSIAEFVICSCHLLRPNAINAVNCLWLKSAGSLLWLSAIWADIIIRSQAWVNYFQTSLDYIEKHTLILKRQEVEIREGQALKRGRLICPKTSTKCHLITRKKKRERSETNLVCKLEEISARQRRKS